MRGTLIIAALTAGGCGRIAFDPAGGAGDAAPAPPDAATHLRLPLALDRFVPAEPLADFPLLVRLDEAALPAALLRPDLANLRFVDASGQVLGAEHEPGDATARTVWVQVPSWSGPQTIYAEVDPRDAPFAPWTSPWSDAYVMVHHFADGVTDATGHGHDLARIAGAPMVDVGLIGAGLRFTRATGECAAIADDPTLRPPQWTVSIWYRTHTPLIADAYVVAVTRQEGGGFLDDFAIGVGPNDALDTWYHGAVVFDGATAATYRDGVLDGSRAQQGNSANPIHVGCDQNVDALNEFFDGPVDELRFENVVRSDAWRAADLASMRDQVVTVGVLAPR